MTAKKRGPKPKPPSKVRSEFVTVFLTKAEKRKLVRLADRQGRQSLSKTAHTLLVRAMEGEFQR